MTTSVRFIKVAVLVTAKTRPKDLSQVLDEAFQSCDEVLEFVVEGHGWDGQRDLGAEFARKLAEIEAQA
jgi:hypothetical protein